MFPMFSLPTPLFRRTAQGCTLIVLLGMTAFASGQSGSGQGASASIHAGYHAGPVALHTERSHSFGAHNLGNTGYGHALSIQGMMNGPWEVEFNAAQAAIVHDDGAMRAWQTEIQSAAIMLNRIWPARGTRNDAGSRNVPTTKGFQPFAGIGLAHVDHIMKQDLEDANGRVYHLWSDGTLRDRDEAGDHAGQANILHRDYTYESDLQDSDQWHGSGRSLAIPMQIGVRLDVSPRVRARMGIGGWLGLTDGVDDRSSGGFLSGDALASGFFGLGIRLGKLGAPAPKAHITPGLTMEDAALLAALDTDGDGVSNLHDRCPGTRGIPVDATGCPLDSDGDGYADYRDMEPHSPHTDVDGHGVALASGNSESDTDKEGWDVIRDRVTSDDRTDFAVRIPEPEDGWTQAERHTLLAFKDLKETSTGVEVGLGNDPVMAGQAADLLRNQGLEADLLEPGGEMEETLSDASATPHADADSQVHFRVQLGAFRAPDSRALDVLFEGVEVIRMKGNDGLTRVLSASFAERADAESLQASMVAKGHLGAFIVPSIPTTTGAVDPTHLPDVSALESAPQFDVDRISFRVQLGALKSTMDTEAMDVLLELGDVEHMNGTGWHRYVHGHFGSAEEARRALPSLRDVGFPDAFVVGDVAGSIVPVAEAEILLRQD